MSNSLVTYIVEKMRVTRPSGKTAEKNPDRLYTVAGTFYRTKVNGDGSIVPTEKLTVASKNIDREDALAEGFSIDLANGTLTLPEGKRGRAAAEGLSAESIAADLDALRAALSDEDDDTETPETPTKK